MSKNRVRATVRVVLEIESDSVWGSDTTFDQIEKQAVDSVRGLLTNSNPLSLSEIPRRIRSLETIEVKVTKENA